MASCNDSCAIHAMEMGFYLPPNPTASLHFLSRLGDNPGASTFTEEQEQTILRAKRWESINWWALRLGLVACTLLSIAPALLALHIVQDWENRQPKNASLMFIITTLYAGAIGMINYLFTGTLPDRAAMLSIEASTAIQKVQQSYEKIALTLLALVETDPQAALTFATSLDINRVQDGLKRCVSETLAQEISAPLAHAKRAILEDVLDDGAAAVIMLQWRITKLKYEGIAV